MTELRTGRDGMGWDVERDGMGRDGILMGWDGTGLIFGNC